MSTRTEDFLVDVLALRGDVRGALGPIFEDPRVCKVMHGADSDIVWLQRDFGVYCVNQFDTGRCAIEENPLGVRYDLESGGRDSDGLLWA